MTQPIRGAFRGEPVQIPFNGGPPTAVWTGYGSAGGVPVLCINQDTSNTVYLGYQNNIAIGGGNTIPLAPGASIPLDGSRTIYAIAATGTAALLVIPGASSFFAPITSLTIPTGATSGARIVLNGLTGTITVYGSDNRVKILITSNPAGIFFYT